MSLSTLVTLLVFFPFILYAELIYNFSLFWINISSAKSSVYLWNKWRIWLNGLSIELWIRQRGFNSRYSPFHAIPPSSLRVNARIFLSSVAFFLSSLAFCFFKLRLKKQMKEKSEKKAFRPSFDAQYRTWTGNPKRE